MKVNRDKPDYILNLGITPEIAVSFKDAKRMGVTAPQVTCSGAIPADVVSLAGAEASEGHLMMFYMDAYGMASTYSLSEGAKLNKTLHERYTSGEPLSSVELYGTAQSMVIDAVVRMALEKVGYDNLTGRAIKEYGFDQLRNFDCMGLIPGTTINFSPEEHVGLWATSLYTSRDGKVVPVQRPVPVPMDILLWE